MAILSVIFWWTYLLACPVVCLAALFAMAWASSTLEGALARGALAIGLLTLIFAPAWTDLGAMSWWLFRVGGLTSRGEYFIWQFALACLALYAGFVLLVAWIRRDR
jgi:hypothetical protein